MTDERLYVRVLQDHTDNSLDYHEWVYLGKTVWLDALGRVNNSGATFWLVVACNNPECKGEVIVREADVIGMVVQSAGLEERSPRRSVTTAR